MARTLAALHVAYGIVAMALSGLGFAYESANPDSGGGCCGASYTPIFLVLLAIIFALAVPQLVVALMFLRRHPHGALWMTVLSAVNLLINGATVSLVLMGGSWAVAAGWLPFLAANVAGLLVFPRRIGLSAAS